MPGEVLLHATEGAVATSTLVLGCLFTMLGAKPQARKFAKEGAPSAALGLGLPRGQPLSLHAAGTGALAGPAAGLTSAQAPKEGTSTEARLPSDGGGGSPSGESRSGKRDGSTGSSGGGGGDDSTGRRAVYGGYSKSESRGDRGSGPEASEGRSQWNSWTSGGGGRSGSGGYRGGGGGSDDSGSSNPQSGDGDGGGVVWLLALAAVLACWSPLASFMGQLFDDDQPTDVSYGEPPSPREQQAPHSSHAAQPELQRQQPLPAEASLPAFPGAARAFKAQQLFVASSPQPPAPLPGLTPAHLITSAGVLLGVAASSVIRVSRLGGLGAAPITSVASAYSVRQSSPPWAVKWPPPPSLCNSANPPHMRRVGGDGMGRPDEPLVGRVQAGSWMMPRDPFGFWHGGDGWGRSTGVWAPWHRSQPPQPALPSRIEPGPDVDGGCVAGADGVLARRSHWGLGWAGCGSSASCGAVTRMGGLLTSSAMGIAAREETGLSGAGEAAAAATAVPVSALVQQGLGALAAVCGPAALRPCMPPNGCADPCVRPEDAAVGVSTGLEVVQGLGMGAHRTGFAGGEAAWREGQSSHQPAGQGSWADAVAAAGEGRCPASSGALAAGSGAATDVLMSTPNKVSARGAFWQATESPTASVATIATATTATVSSPSSNTVSCGGGNARECRSRRSSINSGGGFSADGDGLAIVTVLRGKPATGTGAWITGRRGGPLRSSLDASCGGASGLSSRAASCGSGATSHGGTTASIGGGSARAALAEAEKVTILVTTNLHEEIAALGATSSGLSDMQARAERWLRRRAPS